MIEQGSRWQLSENCLFVDARSYETGTRYPEIIPFAHVLNREDGSYIPLNDTAGFITRFIALGVETSLIYQIYRSEYGDQVKDPVSEVDHVIGILKENKYIKKQLTESVPPYEPAAPAGERDFHKGCYPLDFGVYSYGTTCVKLPPCPLPPIPPH